MAGCEFSLGTARLTALGSGALWWAAQSLLCVSDLHLCKSERMARRGGPVLPPYETRDTLTRLSADLDATQARIVVCLGDSFDDLQAAHALLEEDRLWITKLQAGREWIWIEGNHDPGPIGLGGTHLNVFQLEGLTFRHIAEDGEKFEISGHYHPKIRLPVRGRGLSRPAFLRDRNRVIMPAYGTYTGGLRGQHPSLKALMRADATAILTGPVPTQIPMGPST